MCDPATLAVSAAVMSTISAGVGAVGAASQARYQAKIADRNADMASEAAAQEQENTRQSALQHYRQVAQLKGKQRAAMAANGIDLNFGSALDVQGDTEMLAREDTSRIYQQGFQRARGYDVESANYGAQANASRQAAKGALIKGAFDMGSTALGGASQYGQLKAKYG